MTRRKLLTGLLAAGFWTAIKNLGFGAQPSSMKDIENLQKNWKVTFSGRHQVAVALRAAQAVKRRMAQASGPNAIQRAARGRYRAPRHEPSEQRKAARCIRLRRLQPGAFTSDMKYESGTGWPSFFTTIPGVFANKTDYKLILPRSEYHCIRCGGHHGHVFDDGPPPTGKRWCNNGVALKFIPKSGKA